MNVIRHSTRRQKHAVLLANNSADVVEQALFPSFVNQRFAVFRAKDEMVMQASEG